MSPRTFAGEHAPYVEPASAPVVIDEDCDHNLVDSDRLPYQHVKILGNGMSAVVEQVFDTRTKEVYARKTIKYSGSRGREEKEVFFHNEVNITRVLKGHHHIIRLFATYEAPNEFVLLLQPAADGSSLEDYLSRYWDYSEELVSSSADKDLMTRSLEKTFGCLANGLNYIHKQGIRHRDIKPQNILMHRHSVVITDFGSSKNTTQSGERVTEGAVDFQTRRYSAPEVLEKDKRSFDADVYSLGCVFIEILSALSQVIDYDPRAKYAQIMDQLHISIDSALVVPHLAFLKEIIKSMTMRSRVRRFDIGMVDQDIRQHKRLCCSSCEKSGHWMGTKQVFFSNWMWVATQNRYYCYILDERNDKVGHKWSGNPHITVMHDPAKMTTILPVEDQAQLKSLQHGSAQTESSARSYTEVLDQRYRRVHTAGQHNFFRPGRVFKMLWSEPAGAADSGRSRSSEHFSTAWLGGQVFSEIRHFVVVRNKDTFSQCIPIHTYEGRGVTRPGLIASEHGIIHTTPTAPDALPEEKLDIAPLRVLATADETLDHASRLNYGKPYAVEHNVKVFGVGMVAPEHQDLMISSFNTAIRGS